MTLAPESLGRDKQPKRIAGMFDAIAPRYDVLNHLLSAGLDVRWRTRAIRALALDGSETILDLCAGTADLAIAAATARPPAARVVGVDFAGQMLRLGAEKLAPRGLSDQICLVQGDAMGIPLAGASVDAAMVAFGIRNVEQPQQTYAEVFRVLRPGGRFAILEFGLPPMPGVRQAYLWYFRHVLPRIGGMVSGHASAYAYLPESVETFPAPALVLSQLQAAGFCTVKAVPLTFGVVYLYSAAKPLRP
ncbi:MAG: bifunctional demethylmenaquinone methyltransferase/2-methoxy-6-polyprenyl-1,4-benzoquinol methylase UbiE [Acidobacteria bacterium]|nr:bifunctional demethylmenaquinone methyltransferase/2-methoxy-6-polyprenyl-1,4-benzoquinol methylase UbiE [Acidobacteriota bacterium]